MNGLPQFTLITSTYNSEQFLDRCLRSVEAQTDVSLEHLIVDGASTDKTLTIVDNYSHRYPIKLCCSAQDTGIYEAWNRGVVKAKGQWIFFLGSDDFLVSSDALRRVRDLISLDPSLESLSFLYGDTISTHERASWHNYCPNKLAERLRGVTEFPTSVFINSVLFRQGSRFDETYRICADHKFFAQHNLFSTGAYLPVSLIAFQDGGISSRPDLSREHYRERCKLLFELNRPRPWFTDWYYWLRSFGFPPRVF